METNLILTAKKWELASQLERTKSFGGVQLVKNVPERTYLAITSKQWVVLTRFKEPRTVPQVLEAAIEERFCPELGEFYELILKAVRDRILVEPGQTVMPYPAASWPVALKARRWAQILWTLLVVGLGLTVAFRPELPLDWPNAAISAGFLIGAVLLGSALSASLLRGAGAEVYFKGWRICTADACMLPPSEQRLVAVAPLGILAAVTGVLAWQHPEWGFLPLLGLVAQMRPIFGGAVNTIIRVGAKERVSDTEHHYIFGPNRSVRRRWRLLRRSLGSAVTWLEIFYGMVWTLALAYFFGGLAEVPPWKLAFWQMHGVRLALAAVGSLGLLGLIYVGLESYVFARDRALARHETLRQWYKRWFRYKSVATDEEARLRAVLQSPALRLLVPADQKVLAKAFQPHRLGAWQVMNPPDNTARRVSLVVSGQVGVYRQVRSGRRVLVQVLSEGDLVGLHAVADQRRPDYLYRTLTPVALLQLEWVEADGLILDKINPASLANQVHKVPFLARIGLCQNWHRQAIQRFAELSHIKDYVENDAILQQGFYSDSFYIMLEGEAHVMAGPRRVAIIGSGSYFGEIGLLQNSNATARVVAQAGARCLCIPRREFLRFVAHNYSVALELEHVSSKRLGYPIFPLTPGNFRTL
ncbi:MAG TPA: cyclic nucleotide-binding domain-containing protein [Lacunisphaera sp.]|nr:cyclic nucleotide-binding domain-containing protein [Lacunisphaera sp.]